MARGANDNAPLYTDRDAMAYGEGEVTVLCHGDLWCAFLGSPMRCPRLLPELVYLAPKFETRAHAVDWAVRNPHWLGDAIPQALEMQEADFYAV
jgi:hypothetical protein